MLSLGSCQGGKGVSGFAFLSQHPTLLLIPDKQNGFSTH